MRFKLSTLALAISAIAGVAQAQAPAVAGKPKVVAVADRAPTSDEELALAALEGLLAQPGERALPILKKVLAGPQSTLVKQRALFVLSQIDSAEARQILAQTSRSTNEELRREAIRSIGISGDPTALDSLQELYDSGNREVKSDVLQAWLIAGRKEAVYQAALNAKTEDEATEAIRMLGAMGATEELRKLGDRPNAAKGLLEAYAIGGDLESLRKIAAGDGSRENRLDAVRKIGIVDGDAARAALRDIYTRSGDADIREAALQGMLIADDEQGVLALYRAAGSSEEKRSLLRTLSLMSGDAALEAIDQALGQARAEESRGEKTRAEKTRAEKTRGEEK
jgi:HEAT repeat protein